MDYKFITIQSYVDSSFFTKLAELKLDKFKLNSKPELIKGFLNHPNKLTKFNNVPVLNLNYRSFDFQEPTTTDYIQLEGYLFNVNTIEEFKSIDKHDLLKKWGHELLEDYMQGRYNNQFRILTFCDLKKYKFYYWVAYPNLQSKFDIVLEKSDFDFNTVTFDRQFHIINNENVFIDNCLSLDHLSMQLNNFIYYSFVTNNRDTITYHVYKFQNDPIKLTVKLKEPISKDAKDIKVSGWERTSQGKLGPKIANLGTLIDPTQLASQAVDLNLRLMKWRIAPNLNLDIINNQKVLLLGAGTLGSYVSRALLGWGVRKITFVDNGRVSYSNPVRQPLFSFLDCFAGEKGQGSLKATRASEALKEIFPGVISKGFDLEVPMIGHPITNEMRSKADYDKLEELFHEHDIIFLLMDSRESRWLPTVMGIAKNKLVINAALGFDSYVVLRHGTRDLNLGCYYCNDVVAPNDSLSDRTLDQMCTVTRPGAAMMASSLAVELLISVLQHPDHQKIDANSKSILGDVPHQIRGFLHNFTQHKLSAPKYKYCSACSQSVVDEYLANGWEFVKQCLNDVNYLEQLCGLKSVQEQAEIAAQNLLQLLEMDDTDEDNEWLI